MITVNDLNLKGLSADVSTFESELAKGIIEHVQKYETTVTLELDTYSDAPTLIADAIMNGDCASIPNSDNPSLIENTFFQITQKESLCLDTEVKVKGKRDYWGLDINKVGITPKLDSYFAKKQSRNALYSALKTFWLGDKTYVGGDLVNPALLPAYKLDNGQWTKILAVTPANVAITQNALATEAAQMVITSAQVLAYVDKMLVAQSKTMKLASNGMKFVWMTPEMYDVVAAEREKNIIAGLTLQNVNTLYGNFETIIYKGLQLISFEHFAQAIRDLDPTVVGALNQPHRMVLTIGLPKIDFQLTENGNFESYMVPVANTYTAGTTFSVAQPEAVAGDFYVTAY